MTSIFDQYYGNLLADVSYVNFGPVGYGETLSRELFVTRMRQSSRFSEFTIQEIADRFEVVSTINFLDFAAVTLREKPLIEGVEVEGLGREAGRIWVAIRGTEPTPGDLALADGGLAITGTAIAQDQIAQAYVGRILDPLLGGGIVSESTTINLTGHSLGGHLALNVGIAFEPRIAQLYTTNTANVGGMLVGILKKAFTFAEEQQLAILAPRISNVSAVAGLQTIGSFLTGVRDGAEGEITTETEPSSFSPLTWLDQHFMWPVTDSFEVSRVLAAAMPSMSNAAISDIVQSASSRLLTSLEATLAPMWRLLHPEQSQRFSTASDMNGESADDDNFHRYATQLFNELANQQGVYQLISMVGNAESLFALAKQDNSVGIAVRDALVNGDPYALVGAQHSSEYSLSNFSQKYLYERAQFIANLLTANKYKNQILGPFGRVLVAGGRSDYYAEDIGADDQLSKVVSVGYLAEQVANGDTSIERRWFGGTDSETFQGSSADERIFGGAGADTLLGGAGNDIIDGGSGADTLAGGAGYNTLDGGAGGDTYVYATGDGPTVIEDTGSGDSIAVNLSNMSFMLGSGQIRRLASNVGAYVDDWNNHFNLTGMTLTVSLADGGKLTLNNFSSGDYGITLPSAFQVPTSPGGAHDVSVPANVYEFPPGGLSSWVGDQPDVTVYGGFLGYTSQWHSPSGWSWTTTPDVIHLPDNYVPSSTTSFLERDGVSIPMVGVYAGLGDSIVYGGVQSDFITDDTAFYFGRYTGRQGLTLGNDYIFGGGGDDFIDTHSGDDRVYAGDGNDVINAIGNYYEQLAPNTLGANIWLQGDRGWYYAGNHTNRDELFGEGGNDIIASDVSSQTIDGGIGDDILTGGAQEDFIEGGDGDDFIGGDLYETHGIWTTTATGYTRHFSWDANYVSETVEYGDDTLSGGAGNDVVIGGGGKDVIDGGDGDDRLLGDLERLDVDSWWSGLRFESLQDLASDPVSIGGADVIRGGDGNDEIIAGGGDDLVDGGAGNDYIAAGTGSDIVDGGSGSDQIFGDYANGAQGDDVLRGGDGNDTISGLGGNDRLDGDAGDDVIDGGDGDDTLSGGAGFDSLIGGAGNDVLVAGSGGGANFGGAGNDTLVVNRGDGIQQFTDSEGSNLIRFGTGVSSRDLVIRRRSSGGNPTVAIYYGTNEYVYLTTTDFDNLAQIELADGTSIAPTEIERFTQIPTDPLQLGDNTIHLNAAPENYSFRTRNDDLLIWHTGTAADWANTSDLTAKGAPWSLGPAAEYGLASGEVLVLHNWYQQESGTYLSAVDDGTSAPRDLVQIAWDLPRTIEAPTGGGILASNGGADALVGSSSSDLLFAGDGNDQLSGGGGDDILVGEGGGDTYVIDAGNGTDVIVEESGADTIRFVGGITSAGVVFHETMAGLEVVVGPAASNNRVEILNWSSGPENKIEQFMFVADGVTWSAAEVESRIAGNRRPVAGTISDLEIGANQSFSFSIPNGTFLDPNGDTLTIAAVQSDGSALPSWITFNTATNSFSGVQPATGSSAIAITVTAADSGGYSDSSTFTLSRVSIINGTSSGETITGTAGRDIISAGGGNDIVNALDGDDSVDGGSGADTIRGGQGNDAISGGTEDDSLYGDGGDDVFTDGLGNDHYEGGTGNDTYIFDRPYSPSVREQNFINLGSSDETDTVLFGSAIAPSDVRVVYTAGDARLLVGNPIDPETSQTEVILQPIGTGLGGLQVKFVGQPGVVWTETTLRQLSLSGSALSEIIRGFAGDDVIRGYGGDDQLYGNSGNDDLRGDAGRDQLFGEGGDDVYRFGRGDLIDEVDDSEGSNRIVLDAGILPSQVTLYRTSSMGMLDLGNSTGDDLVIAIDNGQDQLRIENFFDPARAGTFTQLEFTNGTIWNSATILANTINQSGVSNQQTGTAANETFTVDHWSDFVLGMGGTDTVNSSVNFQLGSDLENLTLTGTLDINASGNSGANVLTGNSGANTLDGRGGIDTMVGGAGDDTYYIDGTAAFDPPNDTVTELAGGGTDTIIARSRDATLPNNVENLVAESWSSLFSSGVQQLVGNSLDNVIDARDRSDSLGNWPVRIDGGAGADLMIGSAEGMSNRYVVDNIGDVVREVRADPGTDAGTDTIESWISYTMGDRIEVMEMMSSTATTGTGNSYANRLDGSTGTGAHTLVGLGGDDVYVLGTGDTAVEAAGGGSDTVTLTTAAGFSGGVVNLSSFANIENLAVASSFGVATLNGDAGANVLSGNASVNTLIGGQGDDTMSGNGGNDVFAGFGAATGNDVILVGTSVTGDARTVEFSSSESLNVSQLQFSRSGNDLVIQTSPGNTIRVQSFLAGAQPLNFKFSLYSAGVRYDYTAAQVAAVLNGTNGGPAVAIPIPDSPQAIFGQAFSYQIAANAFTDIESQSSLVYSATLADGSALPAWLSFNATNRTFSGMPSGAAGPIVVRVRATDAGSAQAFDDFVIDISAGPIIGTSGNDNLIGTSSNDIMQGLAGNDTLNGGLGTDQMSGGLGDDTYVVDNVGDTTIEAVNEGTDLVQSAVAFSLAANVENLTLTGSGNINGTGNGDNNLITGNLGNNTLLGGGGNDTLDAGSAGTDSLQGQAGDDTYIWTRSTGVTITEAAGEGTDTVQSSLAFTLATNFENLTLTGSGNITGTGNTADNVLIGNSGDNTLTGNSGNDTLDGGSAGTDILNGGQGDDTFIVNRSTGLTLQESTSQGTDTVSSSITFTLATNFENLTLTGTGDINGTGNTVANVIVGNSGNNRLSGGAGGADTLTGGAGNDVYIDPSGDTINEIAGGGTDTVESVATFSIASLAEIENLTLTNTSGTVTGTGNAGNNVLTGSSGSNTLIGGGGNDTLDAGTAGTDSLQGQSGDDTYIWTRSTGVTITEAAGEGTDTVMSSLALTLATNFENLTLTGSGNINGTGNTANNAITGNSGNNTLAGGGGNDTLDAGTAGTDILQGQAGDDTYIWTRSTGVTLTEAAGEGTDTVQSSLTFTLATNFENLTLTGSGNINGTGNSAGNVIIGNTGSNVLTGGLGADTYRYASGGGTDTIDNVAADSLIDRLQFTDLSSTAITLSRTGNNLVMTRVGVATDVVTVTNWFSATANRLDFVDFTNRTVTAAEIDTLVNGGGGSFPLRMPVALTSIDAGDRDALAAQSDTALGKTIGGKSSIAGRAVWRPIKEFTDQRITVGVAGATSLLGDAVVDERPADAVSSIGETWDRDFSDMTLGGKSAVADRGIWRPIKNFTDSRVELGVERLIGAMNSFGTEQLADRIGDRNPQELPTDFAAAVYDDLPRRSRLVHEGYRAAIE